MPDPSRPAAAASTDERREQVVRATCAVIARDGLERTSLRAIAHELGLTTGVLTHNFRDKDALLAFVLDAIIANLELAHIDLADDGLDLARVEAMIASVLPQADDTAVWWRVWVAFTAAALVDARLGARHTALYTRLREFWVALLRSLQARGQIRSDLDPVAQADAMICLVDGIGIQALISPKTFTPARQQQLVALFLSGLAEA